MTRLPSVASELTHSVGGVGVASVAECERWRKYH